MLIILVDNNKSIDFYYIFINFYFLNNKFYLKKYNI